MDMNKRGKICFSKDLLFRSPLEAKEILNKTLVIQTDFDIMSDKIIYHVICEDFNPVKPGDYSPYYDCQVTKDDAGFIEVKFKNLGTTNYIW